MSNHYLPQPKEVNSRSSVYFDGSSSSTGAAYIQEISGDFNTRVYLERESDGSFTEVSQFPTLSLEGKWHTDEITTRVVAGTRRIRIDNVDKNTGTVEVIGDEI